MFQGFTQLGDAGVKFEVLVKNSSGVPVNADALPTFRVYGPAGAMAGGTGTAAFKDSGSVTGASNASPIVVTSAGHNLSVGARVTLTGVGGNTGANGTFAVTAVTTDTFTLGSSTGAGSYTSGGAWNVTGLYSLAVDTTVANGYAAGVNYSVLTSGLVSSAAWANLDTFTVT